MADKKDVEGQMTLFTEDATVTSYFGESSEGMTNIGKEKVGTAFSSFLNLFKVVYHINGQQVVDIKGDRATGTAYCLVVMIGEEQGNQVRTTHGVRYEDIYVKENDKWLISDRNSYFMWSKSETISDIKGGI